MSKRVGVKVKNSSLGDPFSLFSDANVNEGDHYPPLVRNAWMSKCQSCFTMESMAPLDVSVWGVVLPFWCGLYTSLARRHG